MINYIKTNNCTPLEIMSGDKNVCLWEDDKFLKPVGSTDAWLMLGNK